MRTSVSVFIFVLTIQLEVVLAFDITPEFKKDEKIIYTIETIDEYPPKKNKRSAVHMAYKASILAKEQSDDRRIFEWKYIPVDNPVRECFTKNIKENCYSEMNDIKQKLVFDYSLNKKGVFRRVHNRDDISARIGAIFDEYAKNNER